MLCSDSLSWATGPSVTGPSVCFSVAYIDFYPSVPIDKSTSPSTRSEKGLWCTSKKSVPSWNNVVLSPELGTPECAWKDSDKWCWYPELPFRLFRLDPSGLQLFPFGEQTSFYVITRRFPRVLFIFSALSIHTHHQQAEMHSQIYDKAWHKLYFEVHVLWQLGMISTPEALTTTIFFFSLHLNKALFHYVPYSCFFPHYPGSVMALRHKEQSHGF